MVPGGSGRPGEGRHTHRDAQAQRRRGGPARPGDDVDLLIDPSVLEHSTAAFPAATDQAIDHERVNTYVYPEPLSFGLGVHEESATLVAYDEENNPRAVLESDADGVVDWATGLFDRLVADATPLAEALSDAT